MFTDAQKYEQGRRSALLIEDRGHFAYSLAQAYLHADPKNAMRLRDAFPELLQIVPLGEELTLGKAYFINQFQTYLEGQRNEKL
jgi:hypothetical protein